MLLRLARAARAPGARRQFDVGELWRRRFSRGRVMAMGHGSHSSDNNPETLQREKERNLRGQTPEIMPGAPGWNPALASDAEAAIKAEQAPELPIEELQERTVKILQHLHHDADVDVPAEVHDPSGSEAIRENLKDSASTAGHQPL